MALAKKVDDDALFAQLEPLVVQRGLALDAVRTQRVGELTRINVIVDLPPDQIGSADLDTVTEVSRAISAFLDEVDSLVGPGPSNLEVTTPGVFRPLTELRHFSRARTRLLAVTLTDGREFTGRLMEVDGETLIFDVAKPAHQPKKRKKTSGTAQPDPLSPGTHAVPWTTVANAEVQLEFR